MNYLIYGINPISPKKKNYVLFPNESEETLTSLDRREATILKDFQFGGVLFIVNQLNKENFKGMKWDYEVLTEW